MTSGQEAKHAKSTSVTRVLPRTVRSAAIPRKIFRLDGRISMHKRKHCGLASLHDVITGTIMNTSRDPNKRLDELLKALASRPIPAVPPNLDANVRREVRLRRDVASEGWIATFFHLLKRPALAGCAFAIASVLGVLSGALMVSNPLNDARMARQSLSLDVFAANAPGLPAVLMDRR